MGSRELLIVPGTVLEAQPWLVAAEALPRTGGRNLQYLLGALGLTLGIKTQTARTPISRDFEYLDVQRKKLKAKRPKCRWIVLR